MSDASAEILTHETIAEFCRLHLTPIERVELAAILIRRPDTVALLTERAAAGPGFATERDAAAWFLGVARQADKAGVA